jgi:osmotically-inducible protein OsmY
MRTDQDLRKDVTDELDFEPSLEASGIAVAVHNGVVTLSGHVSSYAQKRSAEQAVSRVRGVKAIAQEIEVRLPSDKKRTDDEIAERAVRILQWDVMVPSEQIQVKVEHGWITLSGEVEWQYQREAAMSAVHRLSGVIGVTNQISVRPRLEKSNVRDSIEHAFERQASLDAAQVQVSAEGEKVTLSGHVGSWHERNLANQAAWSVPGVKTVIDRLTVG